MANRNSRLVVPVRAASYDGRYWGRYPFGDKPNVGAALAGDAQDRVNAGGSLSTQIRLGAGAQDVAAAGGGINTGIKLAAAAQGRVGASAALPSSLYTPILKRDFSGGTNGSLASGSTAFIAPESRTIFSNAITGPYGEPIVCRTGFTAQDQGAFGGQLWGGSLSVSDGDDLWIRVWDYFPSTWNFGYSPNNPTNDGWLATKWFRYFFSSGGDNCWQTAGAGNLWGLTCESGGNFNLDYPTAGITAPTLPRNQWICRDYHVRHHNNASLGFIRAWQDGVFIGQINGTTKAAGAVNITQFLVGNYYNGGAPGAQVYYMANIIVTTQTPDAVDSGGRPLIGMTRKVADFP